jgi:phenylalanyl-tRNA synthetase beta chain
VAPPPRPPATTYRELPHTPPVMFDLALLVPDEVPASRVEEVTRAAVGDLLERLVLFDVFRGGDPESSAGRAVPAGMRSLAWRLTLRDPQRTLRDKEVEGRRQKLLRALEGELGVRQRAS